MRTTLITAAAALAVGLTGQASATSYTFTLDERRTLGDQSAGVWYETRITFDDGVSGANDLDVDPTLDLSGRIELDADLGPVTGGWFALTPGGDPRLADDEIAIFYMDFATGRLSAYRYDGNMNEGFYSWQRPELFITTWADAIRTDVSDDGFFSFSIDDLDIATVQTASDNPDYTGVGFGAQIGVWMHLSVMREAIAFDEDGRLTSFSTGPLASLDMPRRNTDPLGEVPIPGAALFLATGVAGFAAARRARR